MELGLQRVVSHEGVDERGCRSEKTVEKFCQRKHLS